MSTSIDVKTAKTGFWHMPRTFYAVLLIEFWERFAFYGLQSIAVIYFVQKFGLTEADSDSLVGSFSALLYALLTIGGAIGDKLLGLSRTYFLGIVSLILGYAMLSLATDANQLYWGMGIILVGNVFFKTNATNYVSRCFETNDPRLDSAFTYFYMSINLGSFVSMILVPVVSQAYSYSSGLALCSLGMLVGLGAYFCFRQRFKLSDNQIGRSTKNLWVRLLVIALLGIVAAWLFSYLLRDLALSKMVLYFIAVVTLVVYLFIASKLNRYEAKGMYVALILMLQAIVFFILYIQQATSMTLFALHNVRLTFLGYLVPAGVTQSLDPLFIFIFSPILATFYINLYKKDVKLGIPAKFVAGILLAGLGFISLGLGANFFADQNAQVSVLWMVLGYGLFALGELLISALGPSMVAQLLPKRLGGFAQGVWFLATAIGMRIGSQMSALAANEHVSSADNFVVLYSYMNLFYKLGFLTVIVGLVLLFSVKPMSRILAQIVEHKY
jgi:POT family proton-dependent oligopeptide transporter